jgi:hypothetical protein
LFAGVDEGEEFGLLGRGEFGGFFFAVGEEGLV